MTDEERRWADPHATEAVRKFLRRHRRAVEIVLTAARLDGLDEIADAAAEYAAAPEGPVTPGGAAAVFAIAQHAAVAYRTGAQREREFMDRFIDSWMNEHGHAFTVAVTEARVRLRVEGPDPRAGRMTPWLRTTAPDEDAEPAAETLQLRVRARLGAGPPRSDDDPPRPAADPRSVTTDQIRRLEAAMVDGRRWRAAAHRRLVLEDPALGQLARRLVWASFDGRGTVTGAFRVDAEGVLRGADDDPIELSDETLVGVAHPAQLGDSVVTWQNSFADNRLRQPFEQLERATYVFAPEEAESNRLSRFTDRQVRTDRVFGLQELGWELVRESLFRRFGPTREVTVTLEPGLEGGYRYEPELQRILAVELRGGTFGVFDAVTASELIRQLERLAA
ncbi:DUF4132 domain-containing protein [Nocardia aurantiaca]|uniref:DUF4132 domain-containing protein n=1 Tax=Nocardia aurantiaca TaxID=2675850 RepID=A0A6I3KPN7_9NOCA|nr:DUF4132 domain-containing protein [Nocardia aurantiaca]MTE12593.1 DUF4132 domain-containing protein [Nocardia aurantiaca]